jgi:peptidoglycan hydrolase-like protein with peptidoglycan-binding domain
MSQLPKFSLARQLTASVWPGKAADDYDSLLAARFHKLAAAGSTGVLPFSGAGDGAIYFRDGEIIFARSTRTPGPPDGTAAGETPYIRLAAALAMAEPTVDATAELLITESRFTKFRSARAPVSETAPGLGVEGLLAEVARRRRILAQLAPVVTADSTVARIPQLRTPDIRVSTVQWALLIRVRDGSTPRSLAWELGRSVFGTTLEIYRLLALRLLSSAAQRGHRNGRDPEYGPATMSFVRAVSPETVSPERGSSMPADDLAPRGGSGPDA